MPTVPGPITRLYIFGAIMLQSLLTHTPANEPISPMQIVALFIQEQAKPSDESPTYFDPSALARALLLPGNVAAAYMKGETPVDMTDTFERGIEIATRRGAWWKTTKNHEMWVAASWASVFGALISFMQRRTHFLSLLGVLLFGYTMTINSLAPSIQFGLLAASALAGVSERYAAIGAGAEARVKAD